MPCAEDVYYESGCLLLSSVTHSHFHSKGFQLYGGSKNFFQRFCRNAIVLFTMGGAEHILKMRLILEWMDSKEQSYHNYDYVEPGQC